MSSPVTPAKTKSFASPSYGSPSLGNASFGHSTFLNASRSPLRGQRSPFLETSTGGRRGVTKSNGYRSPFTASRRSEANSPFPDFRAAGNRQTIHRTMHRSPFLPARGGSPSDNPGACAQKKDIRIKRRVSPSKLLKVRLLAYDGIQ
jgi:hypothetical protein